MILNNATPFIGIFFEAADNVFGNQMRPVTMSRVLDTLNFKKTMNKLNNLRKTNAIHYF